MQVTNFKKHTKKIQKRIKWHVSLTFGQICLGCAEAEVEVDADGHVARVIGDIKTEKFLVFGLLFIIEQGEDEAAIGVLVVSCPVFLAAIDEGLLFHFLACGHGESDALPYLVVLGVETAGEGEDGEHVVVAIIAFMVMFRPFAVAV